MQEGTPCKCTISDKRPSWEFLASTMRQSSRHELHKLTKEVRGLSVTREGDCT